MRFGYLVCLFRHRLLLLLISVSISFLLLALNSFPTSAKSSFNSNKVFFYDSSASACIPTLSNVFSSGGGHKGAKYDFTDDELRRLWWAAEDEQGSAGDEGTKTELSFFANRYEYLMRLIGHEPATGKEGAKDIIDIILERHRYGITEYSSNTKSAYLTGQSRHTKHKEPTQAQISIARDILNNGNRTIPIQIVNHDAEDDRRTVTNDGETINPSSTSSYISGKTRIQNRFNDEPYTFYIWANGQKECSDTGLKCGDAFGYSDKSGAPQDSGSASSSSSGFSSSRSSSTCDCTRTTSVYTGSVKACGNTTEEILWSALLSLGLTDEQAAGIMANVQAEAGVAFNPVRHEGEFYRKCWTPVNGRCTSAPYPSASNSSSYSNIRNIATDSNGHWDLFQNKTYNRQEAGNHQSYGIGLIQWSFERRINLMEYVESKAPHLVEYFVHPELYSELNSNQLIEKIGIENVRQLVAVSIEFMMQENVAKSALEKIKTLSGSPEDVARETAGIWSAQVEACQECKEGRSSYNARRNNSIEVYNKMKGQNPCGSSNQTEVSYTSTGMVTSYTEISAESSNASGSSTSSQVSTAVGFHAPQNPWLDNAGIENFRRDEASNKKLAGTGKHIDDNAMKSDDTYQQFATDGASHSALPSFIILHWTSAGNTHLSDFKVYCSQFEGLVCPPHFTIDVVSKQTIQHFPLTSPSAAVSDGSNGDHWDRYAIQIEVVGYGDYRDGSPKECTGGCDEAHYIYNFTQDQWEYLAKLMIAISKETGIPLTSSLKWHEVPSKRDILSIDQMKQYIGVMGHLHVEGTKTNAAEKQDPGRMWDYLEPAIQRLGYTYDPSGYGTSGFCGPSAGGNGSCSAIDSKDGGCTKDGYAYYWQGGASWSGQTWSSNCTIGPSGCGISSTAMVFSALTGRLITPPDVKDVISRAGLTLNDNGCNGMHTIPMHVARNSSFGIRTSEKQYGITVEKINAILDAGGMAITTVNSRLVQFKEDMYASWQSGRLTGGGHFIAIRKKIDPNTWQIFSSSRSPNEKVNDLYFDAESIVRNSASSYNWYMEVYGQ